MTLPEDISITAAASPVDEPTGWQPLPLRARTMFTLGAATSSAVFVVGALVGIGLLMPDGALKIGLALAALLLFPALFVWAARKKYRYTRWRLDDDGFALQRGRFWTVETRVPATRVQHLDLVRGPLQRRFDLATLVIHTAGTRHSAVSVAGLDTAEAERLRDTLARNTNDDGDDDV